PELASLRPGTPAPLPLDGPGAHVRLLEAVGAVIDAACRASAPGIVFVDDMHAADEATIDAISYLGHRLTGRALLLVVSWRSEAVPPGHRLRRLAVDAARAGTLTIVDPVRLTRAEVVALVRAACAGVPVPDLERRVYLESEGLPLFVALYLAVHVAGSDVPGRDVLPAGVQGFLTARVERLGPVARQVLGAAAAIGRSFDLLTLREASGRGEEELVGGLEELLAYDVVREVDGPEPSYEFSHHKLRSLVYAETSLARRRLLHRRIANALSRGPAAHAQTPAALVANHLRLAGDDAAAAAKYRVAAEHAAALHAHADALQHLDAALALGDPDIAGAHERSGDLRTLLGDYVGALTAYTTAAAHADPLARARVEHKLGNVHHRRGEWARAEARFGAALDTAGVDRPALRANIQIDLGHTLHQTGRSARGAALAADALGLAQACADTRAQAQAHNLLGVLARSSGDLSDAAAELERSLALAHDLGDDHAHAAALNNLALVRRDSGDLEQARELTEQALTLCVGSGERHREAALENNLADIHRAAGDWDASMEHLKRAVAIFAEVGAEEATRLPEIWKLVSW
ncbi:MAG: tetratricopeptide repeat protein, partial [Actinomycetota bacterium]|nr:tetratricopeptide repeat protein [Actinomycetota bacterium]